MRKLVTLCFKHSRHTEELLSQLELLYWGGGGGEGEGRGSKSHTMNQSASLPSPFLGALPTLMVSTTSLRRHTRT